MTGCCMKYVEGLCIDKRFYRTKAGRRYMKRFAKSVGFNKKKAKQYIRRMRDGCLECFYGGRIVAGKLPKLAGKTIIVIDGNYLLHRNYHSHNLSVRTRKGPIQIGGTYGFMRDILTFVKKFEPNSVVVAWDGKGKTWRHRLTDKCIEDGIIKSGYKSNRKKDKDFIKDFGRQKKILRKLLVALGVMQYCKNGVEADDVVGTYATTISNKRGKCIIISTDKDYYQLLGPLVSIYKPSEDKMYTQSEFMADWDLAPKSWVLAGALSGDAGDNIIGIRGIGSKTACSLIREYGYENLIKKKIDNKWAKKIRKMKKRVKLAEKLKRIKTNLKVKEIRGMLGVDKQSLRKGFRKLQFNSLPVLEYCKHFGERD